MLDPIECFFYAVAAISAKSDISRRLMIFPRSLHILKQHTAKRVIRSKSSQHVSACVVRFVKLTRTLVTFVVFSPLRDSARARARARAWPNVQMLIFDITRRERLPAVS